MQIEIHFLLIYKKLQFGIVHLMKLLIERHNPLCYIHELKELNIVNVTSRLLIENSSLFTDLVCHAELISITATLFVGK